jgi:hypothetical protein
MRTLFHHMPAKSDGNYRNAQSVCSMVRRIGAAYLVIRVGVGRYGGAEHSDSVQ